MSESFEGLRALFGKAGDVACGVFNDLDHVLLARELESTVKKRGFDIVDNQEDPLLVFLDKFLVHLLVGQTAVSELVELPAFMFERFGLPVGGWLESLLLFKHVFILFSLGILVEL